MEGAGGNRSSFWGMRADKGDIGVEYFRTDGARRAEPVRCRAGAEALWIECGRRREA